MVPYIKSGIECPKFYELFRIICQAWVCWLSSNMWHYYCYCWWDISQIFPIPFKLDQVTIKAQKIMTHWHLSIFS